MYIGSCLTIDQYAVGERQRGKTVYLFVYLSYIGLHYVCFDMHVTYIVNVQSNTVYSFASLDLITNELTKPVRIQLQWSCLIFPSIKTLLTIFAREKVGYRQSFNRLTTLANATPWKANFQTPFSSFIRHSSSTINNMLLHWETLFKDFSVPLLPGFWQSGIFSKYNIRSRL